MALLQHLAQSVDLPLQHRAGALDGGHRGEQVGTQWLTSDEACIYLRYVGPNRLRSLYRFLTFHGVSRHYRSPKRLLLRRCDLDLALRGARRKRA